MVRSLRAWFRTPLGRELAETERAALALQLRHSHASTLLQLGSFGDDRRIALFGSVRQYLADNWPDGPVDIATRAEDLPFASDSFDVVVLIHRLEFTGEPHQVLREAERVLAPEGRLLVVGFNPYSSWGVRHLWRPQAAGQPWTGQYIAQSRIEDWCRLLGLRTAGKQYLFHRPPWGGRRLHGRLRRWESVIGSTLPWLGAVHLTVARKHVVKPLQMRAIVRPRRVAVPNGLAQPTTRSRVHVDR